MVDDGPVSDEFWKDVLVFVILAVVVFGVLTLAQQGDFTVEAFFGAITGLALAAAILAGAVGVFFRRWRLPKT